MNPNPPPATSPDPTAPLQALLAAHAAINTEINLLTARLLDMEGEEKRLLGGDMDDPASVAALASVRTRLQMFPAKLKPLEARLAAARQEIGTARAALLQQLWPAVQKGRDAVLSGIARAFQPAYDTPERALEIARESDLAKRAGRILDDFVHSTDYTGLAGAQRLLDCWTAAQPMIRGELK